MQTANPIKSAVLLGIIALIGAALLAGVFQLTADRIEEQERIALLRQLNQVLAPERYNNALLEETVVIREDAAFPGEETVTVYRARRDGKPVALIMRHAAPDGYNGAIHLLTGIDASGVLTGVRVVGHRETPGLGDPIEAERSDWIRQFRGLSLREPPPHAWAVRRDGGVFDEFTGATITPRAVVEAVQRALEYHRQNRAWLWSTPATAMGDEPQ